MRDKRSQRFLYYVTIICFMLFPLGIGHTQDPLGVSRQEIVTPTPPIDQRTQELFGLLTLVTPEGSCSASMLNDFWAITASHCVYSNQGACPQFAANQITLSSNWPGSVKSVQAQQVVTYGTPAACPLNLRGNPFDVALLQVGLHDFGRPDVRPMKLQEQRPMANLTITAYGRGINALAFLAGLIAVPTALDGQYRTADFAIDSTFPNSAIPTSAYSYAGNRGATVAGGDSGGPSYIQDWDDPLSINRKLEFRLLGVHSFCSTICLPGKLCTGANVWTWVSSITQCSDAAILPVRSAILAAIEAVPPDTGFTGTFGNTPDSVVHHKRALYALNIDEPAIAPPGAAIDVQLTFQRCHEVRARQMGCPVTPDLQQWGYDAASHRLMHAPSGKCINISGARRDAGSPIILFMCNPGSNDNTNDKWTLIENRSSIWTFKSDFTGMCLHAVPGHPERSNGQFFELATSATLVQMPCDNQDNQKFSDVDADWTRRNQPH